MTNLKLKLGTRRSLLAWTQSSWVAHEVERLNPGVQVELVGIETRGDRIQNVSLQSIEGKDFFTEGAAKVSPIITSEIPVKATTSPDEASGTSIRFNPSLIKTFSIFPEPTLPLTLRIFTASPLFIFPWEILPIAYLPL